jgi:hypothetical protein
MAGIYREERMYEADVERLIRQADAQKQKRSNLLIVALNWLGEQLILLGTRLQKRRCLDIHPDCRPFGGCVAGLFGNTSTKSVNFLKSVQ